MRLCCLCLHSAVDKMLNDTRRRDAFRVSERSRAGHKKLKRLTVRAINLFTLSKQGLAEWLINELRVGFNAWSTVAKSRNLSAESRTEFPLRWQTPRRGRSSSRL
eukprot:scaffold349467_cov43-Prasinocladus_malaysianus.AAC.3